MILSSHVLRRGRAFARGTRAVTMIEFALVAIPFFLLIFSILEVGMIFWGGFELENATATAARLIRTGQAQSLSAGQLTAQICQQVVILRNCSSSLQVSVQTFATFSQVAAPQILNTNGNLNTNFTQNLGTGGSIMLVNTYYEWPLTTPLTQVVLANLGDGNFLMQASAAFKNEPFGQ